jgi:hypothetical protein
MDAMGAVEMKRCVNARQNETAIDARWRMRMGVFCFAILDLGRGRSTERVLHLPLWCDGLTTTGEIDVVVRSFDRFRVITNGKQ